MRILMERKHGGKIHLTLWRHGSIILGEEVQTMVKFTLRMPKDLNEKLRWLAFKEHRSQHAIVLELLDKGLAKVSVPKEAKQ